MAADDDHPARPEDIHEIAGALPGVELATSWGDLPTYKVAGKGFVIYRGRRKDALDPATGEPYDDVVVFMTPSAAEKEALVQDDSPFFTTPHFDGYDAVLIRLVNLPAIGRDELAEVITDAWLARAPARLVRAWEASSRGVG